MAFEDPIVAEVRDVREKLLADAGGFYEYVRKLKALESGDTGRLVTKVHRHDELHKAVSCAEDFAEYKGKR
ncbi:MAG: hypothetical protein WCP20_07310 [Desulfuromonadales bacterium]